MQQPHFDSTQEQIIGPSLMMVQLLMLRRICSNAVPEQVVSEELFYSCIGPQLWSTTLKPETALEKHVSLNRIILQLVSFESILSTMVVL